MTGDGASTPEGLFGVSIGDAESKELLIFERVCRSVYLDKLEESEGGGGIMTTEEQLTKLTKESACVI